MFNFVLQHLKVGYLLELKLTSVKSYFVICMGLEGNIFFFKVQGSFTVLMKNHLVATGLKENSHLAQCLTL